MKFRKKPVVIEAVQLSPETLDAILMWGDQHDVCMSGGGPMTNISPIVKTELHQLSEPARATIADLLINDLAVIQLLLQMIVKYPDGCETRTRAESAKKRLLLLEKHVRELFNIHSQSEPVAKAKPDDNLGAVREG